MELVVTDLRVIYRQMALVLFCFAEFFYHLQEPLYTLEPDRLEFS